MACALIKRPPELRPTQLQHGKQSLDDLPRRVPFRPLNAADVRTVNAGSVRETVLG